MKNILIAATVGTALLIAFMAAIAGLQIWAKAATPKLPDYLPACITEDSDNCYWDAPRSGNGEGASFVVIDGKVIPLLPEGN